MVYVIITKRKMRTFTNCLILNLAVADLSVALICIPLEIPLEMNGFVWIYGSNFCKVFYPLQSATIFASAFTLGNSINMIYKNINIKRPFQGGGVL